jgi:hypothetical protein
MLCPGARRNPMTCDTHGGDFQTRFAAPLRAGGTPSPHHNALSRRMFLLISFRKSTPSQNRQLIAYYHYLIIKVTVLWGSWLAQTN